MTFPFPSKTSLVAALCVMVPAAAFAQSGSGSSPSNATAKSTPTVTAKKPVVKKSSAEIRRSALKAARGRFAWKTPKLVRCGSNWATSQCS